MSKLNTIRAWKDEGYRLSLSDEERSQVPDNPGGTIDLSDTELNYVAGASRNEVPLGDLTIDSCRLDCGGEPPTWFCYRH